MREKIRTAKLALWLLLSGVLFLGACNGGGSASSPAPSPNAEAILAFETYAQGIDSGFQDTEALDAPTLFVIRSPEELEAFWAKQTAFSDPQPAPPSVDFTTHMLVAVVDTIEPNTGYMIDIIAIRETEAGVIVEVQRSVDAGETITGDMQCVPFHIVCLPRSDKPFLLDLRK